jgi:gliding motility-associated-like protein
MKRISGKYCFLLFLLLLAGKELFPQTAIWIPRNAFTGTAREYAVGFSIGSKGYIGTGWDAGIGYRKDFWEFDPATNSWTQKADFGGNQRIQAVGFSIGTKGYIGTGKDFISCLKDFWEYNPTTNTWTQKANCGGSVRISAVGFKIGSKGYIGTGCDDLTNTLFKDFWEYNPANNTWTQKADFGGSARWYAVGFSIGNKGYLGTGYDGAYKGDFWEYNPATNTWLQKANLPSPQWLAVGFSIGSKGYIGMGYGLASPTKEFWEFDTISNTWTRKEDFGGSARYGGVGFSIGLKGYSGTGHDINAVKTKDFWEYQPVYIYTGNIALSRICVSKTSSISIAVPYTISTSFSPGNVFTAQLSDSSGSFLTPLNIGSRTDTLGGTINASLPPNLTPGFKYRIRVISSNPSFVGADNKQNLSINPKPSPSVTIDDTLQCINENKFSFNNTSAIASGNIAQTFWNFGDGNTANTKTAVHSYALDGILSVKMKTISDSGCADSIVKLVRILPSPTASFTASDTTKCFLGNSFTFTNTSTIKTGTLTYKWYKGNGDSATTKNLTYSYPKPGKFNLKLVAFSNLGCTDTAYRLIQVDSIPVIGFTVNDSTQCIGKNNFVFTNTTTGGKTFTWSLGDGNTSNDTNITHIYSSESTYSVKLKAYANPTCFDSLIKKVYVYASPSVDYSINKDTQCLSGNLFSFYNLSTVKNGTFTSFWDFGDGNSNTSQHANHSYTSALTFKVKLVITSNNGCIDSVTKSAMVINTASLTKTSNNGPICEGQKLELYTDTFPFAKYFWTGPSGFTSNIQNPTIPNANILQSGTYEVTASLFGCVSLPTTTNVIIKALPDSPLVQNNMDICEGEILSLAASSLPNATFSWSGPNGFTSNLDNPTIPITGLSEGGIYSVKATVDGCEGPASKIYVAVHLNPKIYLGKDGSVCKGDEIILDPGLFKSYTWQDNTTKRNYSVKEPGIYWVEVITDYNCKGSDTIEYTDQCPPSFFVPTAFTPNEDTWNDLFMPQGNNIYNYNFKIFDKWGALLFETNDITVGWDGKKNGVDCPIDMYYWYASWYSNWNGEEKKNAKYGGIYLTR